MAAFAKVLLFSAVSVMGSKPPNFPCTGVTPTVLASKGTGWPANCLGLTSQGSNKSSPAECKGRCMARESCSVWQVTEDNYCYMSDADYQATDCEKREGEQFTPVDGERIQHGNINVTESLPAGTFYSGMVQVDMNNQEAVAAKITRCKHQCYSDIYCTVWFFVTGTPTDSSVTGETSGCHLQNKGTFIGSRQTLVNGQTSVGETIAHTCTPVTTTTAPPETDDSINWLLWGLLALLLLAVLIGIGLFCYFNQEKKKPRKTPTRSVKVSPKKRPEPEVLQPLVPMPVVQQPMVTYVSAPPVATTVVTPTYQAVPQAAPPVFVQAPVVSSVAQVPMVATVPGGSVAMPAGGSVVMPAGGSVMMERPQPF